MTSERAPAVQAAPDLPAVASPAHAVEPLAVRSPLSNPARAIVSSAGDPAETEAASATAEYAAGRRVSPLRARALPHRIYRQAVDPGSGPAGLIVEDDAGAADPPRMRKLEFLDALEESMCRAVEEGFEGSQYEGRGCPMVGEAIGFYRRLPAASLEASIRRYAPDTATVRSAREYIPVLTRRVATLLDTFVRTGRVTGIPTELMPMAAMLLLRRAGGIGGLLTAALGGVLAGIGSAVAGVGRVIGGAFRALFMHRSDPVGPSVDAHAVRADLGPGARLDGGVRARMERAFGHDFSTVRIHADPRSGRVAESLGARALTVGQDIAFAPDEYQPGTPFGDAIIAHELAHTIQQEDGTRGALAAGLELDADEAAAGAVASVWSDSAMRMPRRRPSVRKRSGLSLQRCAKGGAAEAPSTTPATGRQKAGKAPQRVTCNETLTEREWRPRAVKASEVRRDDFEGIQGAMAPLVCIALKMHDTKIVLYTAGTSDTSREVIADYKPYPAVNFDPRLNTKTAYKNPRKLLGENAGHSFLGGEDAAVDRLPYLVLGPGVITSDSPATVQYWYEHERFHVLNFLTPERKAERAKALEGMEEAERAKKRKQLDANEELHVYADQFPKWFFRIARLAPKPVEKDGQRTGTFIIIYGGNESFGQFADAYPEADETWQKHARDAVKRFYEGLPAHQSPRDHAGLKGYSLLRKRGEDKRHIFDEWLRSRARKNSDEALTKTLAKDLKIDLTVPPEDFR